MHRMPSVFRPSFWWLGILMLIILATALPTPPAVSRGQASVETNPSLAGRRIAYIGTERIPLVEPRRLDPEIAAAGLPIDQPSAEHARRQRAVSPRAVSPRAVSPRAAQTPAAPSTTRKAPRVPRRERIPLPQPGFAWEAPPWPSTEQSQPKTQAINASVNISTSPTAESPALARAAAQREPVPSEPILSQPILSQPILSQPALNSSGPAELIQPHGNWSAFEIAPPLNSSGPAANETPSAYSTQLQRHPDSILSTRGDVTQPIEQHHVAQPMAQAMDRELVGPVSAPAGGAEFDRVVSNHNFATPQLVEEAPRQVPAQQLYRPADAVAALPGASQAAVSEQVQQLLSSGRRLTQRRAYFSARGELEQALRMVAQSLDAQQGGAQHATELAQGLLALEEAEEFFVGDARTGTKVDLKNIVISHRTPVLKQGDMSLTPMEAMQTYYWFAHQALRSATGNSPMASQAYYGLGKVYAAMAQDLGQQSTRLLAPKSLLMYQLAVETDARNQLAANELGVMLARYGQVEEAKQALLQSIAIWPMAETWHNLSVVHQRLGEVELAERARYEYHRALESRPQPQAGQFVIQDEETGLQWVDVSAAIKQSGRTVPAGQQQQAETPVPPGDRSASQSNSVWNWLPWSSSHR